MAIIKKFRIKSFKQKKPILKLENISLSFGNRQILENIKVKDKSIIDSKKCKKAVKKSEKLIQKQGRMLVRKSGTEPKIRIMGESNNIVLLKRCIDIVKRSLN